MPFYNWDQVEGRVRPGNRVQKVIQGDKFTLMWMERLGPSEHSSHSHDDFDQVCLPQEGELEFTLGDETRIVRPGDVAVVPAGVPHTMRVPAGARSVIIAFFAPPRGDLGG